MRNEKDLATYFNGPTEDIALDRLQALVNEAVNSKAQNRQWFWTTGRNGENRLGIRAVLCAVAITRRYLVDDAWEKRPKDRISKKFLGEELRKDIQRWAGDETTREAIEATLPADGQTAVKEARFGTDLADAVYQCMCDGGRPNTRKGKWDTLLFLAATRFIVLEKQFLKTDAGEIIGKAQTEEHVDERVGALYGEIVSKAYTDVRALYAHIKGALVPPGATAIRFAEPDGQAEADRLPPEGLHVIRPELADYLPGGAVWSQRYRRPHGGYRPLHSP